ncbi:MAG: glycoside hydrolase family 9 protein [Acidothermus sp.]|nr:glycoside hydrolase family 9 protein [Acidothermus sp.]
MTRPPSVSRRPLRGSLELNARAKRLIASAASLTVVASSLAGGVIAGATRGSAATSPAAAHYSLPLALQESLYFYDAQKSGPARSLGDQPLEWRGDSEPTDSCVPLQPMANNVGTNMSSSFIAANRAVLDPDGNGCVDVSGGFHDAGDHVKFGLPQSYAASTLGWGMYEFPQAFQATGTWNHGLDELKWFSDYFMRSTFRDAAGNVVAFAYQVGEGSVDHNYWGPSELQDPKLYPRPAYFATSETPASDQAAGAAAALAVHALLVSATDPTYAAKALDVAKALYAFAVRYRGLGYSGGFYNSSYDEDELAWAAVWLYLATGQRSYLTDILGTDSAGRYTGWMKRIVADTNNTWQNTWVMSWDTKWGGVFSVLDPIVAADSSIPQVVRDQIHYFDKWQVQYWSHVAHDNAADTNFIATTPAGFSYLTTWGSARYNTAAQLEALAYRHNFPSDPQSSAFSDWAMSQMNYLMGDNPANFSYIVGFGSNVPGVGSLVGGTAKAASHPHHADAHGSLTNSQDDPPNDRHILWGALVGGPDSQDHPDDVTTDYVLNEVAVDYSAAFVGALAGLYEYYGQGQPMTQFTPVPEAPENPYYATATVNQNSNQGTQLTVTINNTATHPPHFESDLSARVYFNIRSLWQHGQTIADVSTPVYYDAAAQIDGTPTRISGPTRWGDAASCVYYVTIDWSGHPIGLPPSRAFQFGINAAIGPNWQYYWDSSASYSLTGLANGTYASTPDPYIPVYANGVRVFGQEPSLTSDESCGTTGSTSPSPSPSPTPSPTASRTPTPSPSPSPTPSPTASRTPSPSPSPSPSPTASRTPSPSPSPTSSPGGLRCAVHYAKQTEWQNGATINITITNTGSTTIAGWTLVWSFPNSSQIVTGAWNATIAQSGTRVTATNPASAWNGTIPPNGTSSFGFNLAYSGSDPIPTSFTLNGVACATN